MRRLAFIFIFCLTLASVGAMTWQQYGDRLTAPAPDSEASAQGDALILDPLVIPVLQEGKVTHQLALELTLAFADSEVKDRALVLMPRLQDALLEELHSLYSLRRVRDSGFDSVLVKERLALASERVLGAGEIAGLTLSVAESPKSGG